MNECYSKLLSTIYFIFVLSLYYAHLILFLSMISKAVLISFDFVIIHLKTFTILL